MNVNLNQLRCFYLAAKYKSISKAAEKLFVTPPAITMQMKKLEEWLGFRLLCREGNTINVTKDAQELFGQVEIIFKEVKKLDIQLEQLRRKREGELILGSHYIPAKYIMPKLMAQLHSLHPNLNIKVVLDSVPMLMERVQNHGIHFMLSASPTTCTRIKTLPLFTEEMVLVASPESMHITKKEINIGELKNIPLMLQEHNSAIYHIISEYLADFGIMPCVVMDNISADVIKSFITQDTGAAFLLRFTVQEKLANGELQEIRIQEGAPRANFSLAYLGDSKFSPVVRSLVSSLEKIEFTRSQLV